MKRNEGKYKVVDKLPPGAMLVKDFADQEGVKEPALYNRLFRGTADFEIVVYYERNFIVRQHAKQC
jgi:hypothetical protein